MRFRLQLAGGLMLALAAPLPAQTERPLTRFELRSSEALAATGEGISRPGFDTKGWHAISVPNTVVGALVESGLYPDPYHGMNLRSIPGTTYPIGERFTLLPTPEDSPFKPAWWYRTEFELPAATSARSRWLRFDGINYRANIWLNGTRVAGSDEVVGTFRRFEFDVTALLRPGARNALAVEVFGPGPQDLAIMWVDWNPTPADKNMGLWGPVTLVESGPVGLRHPHVVTQLLSAHTQAELTVTAELWNATEQTVTAEVRGTLETGRFAQRVILAPRERREVRFAPKEFPALRLARPRLWWPYRMGRPELYTVRLEVDVDERPSDRAEQRFGIREVSSELTSSGHRLFRVNGQPVLVRGGGWSSDMLLRPASRERLLAELRYVREMGLNTIRLEGKLESDLFYDLADEQGLLLMPGWCCCDQWELWERWSAENHRVAPLSLHDQLRRLRNHPSVLVWLNGSDKPPVQDVERAYLDAAKQVGFAAPTLSNATDTPGPVSGPSGVKMRGPYDYVPPSYWLLDKQYGGAFGFATEVGPGGAVPPLESLKRMLPADKLWPINEVWRYHAGGDEFKDLNLFSEALSARYGPATDVADYARKAQALAYEGQRAMFEAFGRNKYEATGVIQWMLNNAWPSMIWHLYDYYLRPGGGYYGSKKACEPIHIQYSYDDRSVAVVNDLREPFRGLRVRAEVLDLTLVRRFEREASIDLPADGVVRAFELPELAGLTSTYFVRLFLADGAGQPLSSNFYWLSTQEDVLAWDRTKWYFTPVTAHANLTALAALPATTLQVQARFAAAGVEREGRIKVTNSGSALAFQVHLAVVDDATGAEWLPVFWEDNYLALLPGESRELRVSLPVTTGASIPRVTYEAWNVTAGSGRSEDR